MIKVEKDIANIPGSLKLPTPENFPDGIPSPPITTHARRMEVILNEGYIDEAKYNDRYKNQDIKDALKAIYSGKCAYCEQWVEQSHVEHYRPKNTYYWLAYSWDNLILACATCNQFKSSNFELNGTPATFVNNESNLANIHSSSSSYSLKERPKMINPEVTNPLDNLRFLQNGSIESDNLDFHYTIKTCRINRADLKDRRRRLLDIFKEDITSVLLENSNAGDQGNAIGTIVSKFIRDLKDPKSEFLAFKKYAVSVGWLNELVKEKIDY